MYITTSHAGDKKRAACFSIAVHAFASVPIHAVTVLHLVALWSSAIIIIVTIYLGSCFGLMVSTLVGLHLEQSGLKQ